MSKYQSYDDWRAKCPYYKGAWQAELQCEGIRDGISTLTIRFGKACEMRGYRAAYCDALDGYEMCPLFAAHPE